MKKKLVRGEGVSGGSRTENLLRNDLTSLPETEDDRINEAAPPHCRSELEILQRPCMRRRAVGVAQHGDAPGVDFG